MKLQYIYPYMRYYKSYKNILNKFTIGYVLFLWLYLNVDAGYININTLSTPDCVYSFGNYSSYWNYKFLFNTSVTNWCDIVHNTLNWKTLYFLSWSTYYNISELQTLSPCTNIFRIWEYLPYDDMMMYGYYAPLSCMNDSLG